MNESKSIFPLSNKRSIKGNRRLAREKVLQIVMAYYSCESNLDELFNHIYHRDFYFGDEEVVENEKGKFLRPEEILEMESDIPINWRAEDLEFGKNLSNTIINKQTFLNELLEEFAKNWELDRIAKIDRYLVQSAICELVFFEEIPPKVSINEVDDNISNNSIIVDILVEKGKKVRIKGNHVPILTINEFKAIQQLLERGAVNGRKEITPSEYVNIFNCGECGCKFTPNKIYSKTYLFS